MGFGSFAEECGAPFDELPPRLWCCADIGEAACCLRVLRESRAEEIDEFSLLESEFDAAESKRECVVSPPPDASARCFFCAGTAGFAPRFSLFEEDTAVNGGGIGVGPRCAGDAVREPVMDAAGVEVAEAGFDEVT